MKGATETPSSADSLLYPSFLEIVALGKVLGAAVKSPLGTPTFDIRVESWILCFQSQFLKPGAKALSESHTRVARAQTLLMLSQVIRRELDQKQGNLEVTGRGLGCCAHTSPCLPVL